jgi:hypothetical protein
VGEVDIHAANSFAQPTGPRSVRPGTTQRDGGRSDWPAVIQMTLSVCIFAMVWAS